jgi:integrase
MAKRKPFLPYGAWRGGRPRFIPGSRERALGFKGKDLKHDDGRWYDLGEAHAWLIARRDDIREQRKTGKKLKSPPVVRGRAVRDLWHAYIGSDKFKALAASSQLSYKKWINPLQTEALWLAPVGALDPIILKALHERVMAARGLAMANGMMSALSAALAWGRLHGWSPKFNGQIAANPASRLDLPGAPVRIRIGTDAEIRALVEASDRVAVGGVKLSAIGDAVLTGLFSGQRKKDVLAFIPGEQSNSRIELVQSKTGARVSIPMAPRLVERIGAGRARRARAGYAVTAPNIVIHEGIGRPYNGVTFADHFQQVRAEAIKACPSVADFTFPDLRDTAVTWYARAGCTVPEIASITGHSLASIYSILKHYLALDAELADNAVKKLVDYMEREGLAV